jgi:hypothetical protein
MMEFVDDIVKLFTDIDEGQPLPGTYRWAAVIVVSMALLMVWLFFNP